MSAQKEQMHADITRLEATVASQACGSCVHRSGTLITQSGTREWVLAAAERRYIGYAWGTKRTRV
jgi:hypothetical protein